VFGALVGAIVWNLLTWFLGLPSSSSHTRRSGRDGRGLSGLHHQPADQAGNDDEGLPGTHVCSGAVICFALCVAIVSYGIYLIVAG